MPNNESDNGGYEVTTFDFPKLSLVNFFYSKTLGKPMPYQYKRDPLSDDEVNKLINACDAIREKSVVWTLLDTGLRLSGFANLKKDNIQWQKGRLVIYGKGSPYGKKTKKKNYRDDTERKKANGVSLCRKR